MAATTAAPPQNRAELDALVMKRGELQGQLESLKDRRNELAGQLEDAEGSAKASLEARVQALDDRAARLETDLMQSEDAITDALGRGITLDRGRQQIIQIPSNGPGYGEVVAAAMLGEGVVFLMLGFILYRRLRKRAPARVGADDGAKMEQLQRAVDVIAIEVERISEGQRYVAKMLGEKSSSRVSSEAPGAS